MGPPLPPPPPAFQVGRFYRNRAARTLPVYYLSMACTLPLLIAGWHSAPPSSTAFIPYLIVNAAPPHIWVTLTSFLLSPAIDGPAWTLATLFAFWALFPVLLPVVQRMSDGALTSGLVWCFWAQLVSGVVAFVILVPIVGFWPAFATATMNPITRLPLFLMGMYAGVLCLRHPAATSGTLPWPRVFCMVVPVAGAKPEGPHWHRDLQAASALSAGTGLATGRAGPNDPPHSTAGAVDRWPSEPPGALQLGYVALPVPLGVHCARRLQVGASASSESASSDCDSSSEQRPASATRPAVAPVTCLPVVAQASGCL